MKKNEPLRLVPLAMDDRALKMLGMFLQGPCKNQGVLVSDSSAEVSVIDLDAFKARKVLEENLKKYPKQPIIALSLTAQDFPNAIFLRKPVQIESMMKVIAEARHRLSSSNDASDESSIKTSEENRTKTVRTNEGSLKTSDESRKNGSPTRVNSQSRERSNKHKAAMTLDEKSFKKYIGSVVDIDVHDQAQVKNAYYNPKQYLQGYVQKAVKIALTKNCVLRLNNGWKPITIFPDTREIGVDTDDKQLRLICAVPIKSIGSVDAFSSGESQSPTITVLEKSDIREKYNPEMIQSVEPFLWKLALWTSKGRIPVGVNLYNAFFLKRWPNMTRLLGIPHSMRIAAIMVSGPRTLLDITEALGIRQQYVFAFFSAAAAVGIVGKVERQREVQTNVPVEAKPKEQTSFLGGILRRLRRG